MNHTLSGYDARPFVRNKNPESNDPIMYKILSAGAQLTRGMKQIAYNLPCKLRMNDSPGFARHLSFHRPFRAIGSRQSPWTQPVQPAWDLE